MVKNLIQNVLGCTTALFLLSGCSTNTTADVVEVRTIPVEKPVLSLPDSDPVRMRSIDWSVVTLENYQEILGAAQSKTGSSSLFALDRDGYESLSKNLNDVRRYIEQQNSIIKAYKDYYVRANRTLDTAVTVE